MMTMLAQRRGRVLLNEESIARPRPGYTTKTDSVLPVAEPARDGGRVDGCHRDRHNGREHGQRAIGNNSLEGEGNEGRGAGAPSVLFAPFSSLLRSQKLVLGTVSLVMVFNVVSLLFPWEGSLSRPPPLRSSPLTQTTATTTTRTLSHNELTSKWSHSKRVASLYHGAGQLIGSSTEKRAASRRAVDHRGQMEAAIPSPTYPVFVADTDADSRQTLLEYNSYTEEEGCVPMHPWQTTQYPTCNTLHEIGMASSPLELSYVNEGSQTIVLEIPHHPQHQERMVLKTQLYWRKFIPEKYEQRRMDAIVQERLTSSPYIASIHGFCALSVLAPFAPGGSIHDLIASVRNGGIEHSPIGKLRIGVQIAEGLAALHGIDGDGRPSFAHNDLDVTQHVYHDGVFQLNDFNYGKLLLMREEKDGRSNTVTLSTDNAPSTTTTTTVTCRGESDMGGWKYRAPEDLAAVYGFEGEKPFLLEKADVFSMCNELYMILTNMWLFEGESRKESARRIVAGERPPIPQQIFNSTNEADQVMIKTITTMCWAQDPEERATAAEIANFLKRELYRLIGEQKQGDDGVVRVILPPIVPGLSDFEANT